MLHHDPNIISNHFHYLFCKSCFLTDIVVKFSTLSNLSGAMSMVELSCLLWVRPLVST